MQVPKNAVKNPAIYPRALNFNYWLEFMGIKELVRRLIPAGLKAWAKKYYYRSPSLLRGMEPSDYERLIEAFAPDLESLSRLLHEDFASWLDVQ